MESLKITMVGHSTVKIELGSLKILTDPWFGVHGNIAFGRLRPPGFSREEMRGIDVVLLSHNHFDHIDGKFLQGLSPQVPILAPSVTSWLTRLQGGRNVRGMRSWQKLEIGGVSITAVPAWHAAPARGFVLESSGQSIYFAGDTYCAPFMRRIAAEYQPQVAIMPVTTFRIPLTMGEKGALAAVRLMAPQVVIPIHRGIQPRIPLLRGVQSVAGFQKRVSEAAINAQIVSLAEGESWISEFHEASCLPSFAAS